MHCLMASSVTASVTCVKRASRHVTSMFPTDFTLLNCESSLYLACVLSHHKYSDVLIVHYFPVSSDGKVRGDITRGAGKFPFSLGNSPAYDT